MSRRVPLNHARLHAVQRYLEARRESAHDAAREVTDERARAALRGKYKAYCEAVILLDALGSDRRVSHLIHSPRRGHRRYFTKGQS